MRIDRIAVGRNAVSALVRFEPGEPLRTSAYADLPKRVLGMLPGLARHGCENDEGRRFVSELGDTELGHLLEHATLEIMALAGSPRTFCGSTSWDFARDGRGVYRVELPYDNDLVCLGALKLAHGLIAHLVGEGALPDLAAEVDRLRRLRTG